MGKQKDLRSHKIWYTDTKEGNAWVCARCGAKVSKQMVFESLLEEEDIYHCMNRLALEALKLGCSEKGA
jgi:hypothetical protein